MAQLPKSPLEQFNADFESGLTHNQMPEAEIQLQGQSALDEFNRQFFGQNQEQQERQKSFALEDTYEANGQKDASTLAKDARIQNESGVDPSEVALSFPKRAELMRVLGMTPETFALQYPRLTRGFIDDSTMLAIAKNDIEHFKKLEDTLREIAPDVDEEGATSGWDSNSMAYEEDTKTWLAGSIQGAVGSLGSGLLGAMQFLTESAYETTDARWLRDLSQGIKETQSDLQTWADNQFRAGTANFGTAASWIAGGAQSGFMNVATFLTGLALAALVAATGGTAAPAIAMWANLGLLGLTSFGNSYSDAKRQGLSTWAAGGHGLAQGGLEVATEFLPQKFLTDAIGTKAIVKNLTPENKKFVENVMKYTFGDIAGEQVNTILGGLESWAVLPENKDKTFLDFLSELPEDMAETFVATLIGSGVTVSAGAAISNALDNAEGTIANRIGRDFIRQQQSVNEMAIIKTIDDLAHNAQVASVAPEMLPGLIQKAVGDGLQEAYIDSEVFNQSPALRTQIIDVAPELGQTINDAIENGQDVAVPIETMTKLIQADAVRDVLYQDVRLTKGGLTPRQAQENMMQLGEEAKKIFDESLNDVGAERRVVLEKIQNDVANQLVAAGHSRQNASLEGQLWSAFVNATSERMGMDPDVFYERYKPRVMTSDRFGEVPKRITIPKTLPKRTVERQARVRQSGATQKRATFAPTTVTTDKPVIIQNRDRSRPGLVSQMHKIAASPNYQMVSFSRDFGNGAPVVAYGAVGENQLGREDFAVTAKGESIRVRYAVVEADSVLVSNNVDGTVNPEYNSADASRMRAIAGNGRIAGLQEAFNRNTTAQYVDAMKADAETTGIDSAVIDGMAKPILVRIMPPENVTPDIGDVSNTSTTAQLSDFQQANNDAERLNFDRITFTEDGAIDESSVIDFIQQMPVSEQDTLITKNGRPTQRAYDRLTYALIAKAYQDDELTQLATESTGDEAKNVFKALVAVAPKYVRLLDSEYDLRDVIAGVAHLAIDAQRKGVSLESHIGLSGDLDLGETQVGRANVADPSTVKVAQEVAQITRSYKSIQSLFSTIADEAFEEMLQADSAEADMFGGVQTRTREQVVDGAIASYRSANASDQLFQLIGESGARDLDQSEERWIRIRNLSTAKSMAMMGKDAKSIRLATGWERGADGLWRYEIMDGNWKGTMPTEGVFKLSDIYDAPELYKAYWFLRDLKVEFVEGLEESEGIQGSYNESEGVIRIDTTQLLAERAARNLLAEKKAKYDKLKARIDEGFTKEELEYYELIEIRPFEELAQLEQQIKRYENLILSERLEASQYRLGVLVHEIQHAIQYREGFETGGSPLLFPARENLIGDIRWAKDNLARANKALEVQADLDLPDESEYESKTFAEHKHDKIVAEAQIKLLNESLENWVDPYEAYNKLAGEVESRNVMKRLSLTAEQRRELLLEETEDVLRKDQILKNGVREYYQSASYRPDDVPKTNVEIIGLTKAPFKNVDAAIAWAEENGIVGVMTNEETGGKGEISISKASVREMLNDRQRRKSASIDVHFAALQKIREVIRTSVIVESHPDYRKGSDGKRSPEYGVNDEVFIDIAYGCVKLDGIIYRVKTTLKRYKDPKTSDKAYAYEVSELEVLAGNLVNAATDTNHTSNTSVPVSILLKGVKTVNGLDVLELYQRAWHGTPHIFDQFTLDHIGSGEGVQAHGWGLYFALNRVVAEHYREVLAEGVTDKVFLNGREMDEYPKFRNTAKGDAEYHVAYYLDTPDHSVSRYDDDAVLKAIATTRRLFDQGLARASKNDPDSPAAEKWREKLRELDKIQNNLDQYHFSSEHIENYGRLFEVEIPETDEMLDEQKYFEDQSDYVQDRLKDAWAEIEYDYELEDLTGAEIYQAFVEHYGSPKEASLAMNEHGIEGITYDGRQDGRCYVVFDDKAIKVVEFLQDQKEQAEARGAYNPADRTISIFRKADMSTFLHESAHAFLDIMIDLADMENAPADLKADVQTLMKWFGLKDAAEWKGLSFAQKTDYHEKFARGFESYLREGKAPSSGLRRAFARFKQWLVSLYQSATELNVDVTPEVKAVMDRMVASNKEINQAVSINRLANLWTQENFPGTPTQWEQYKELTKDADEMARAQHNASLVAELSFMRGRVVERRAQLDREYNEAYAKARQQAIDELNNDSIYQMIADFQGDDKQKLSIVEVAEIGNDQLQAVGAHGILADDGYSLEPMAQNYGYGDDVVAFVEAIAGSKPFDQAVEDRARQLMEEDNEELLTDQQRQESAELAALNDLTMRRVEEEYKIAAANKANANVRAAAKVWAEETIENTQVRLLDQNQYRVQAEKFARVAVQAAANHNAQAVAEAKRKQLVNLYAQRQSLMAKNRVRQTEKLARKINRTFKKKLRKGQQDQEFMDQVLGLMHRYGLLEGDYQTNRSFADFKKDFEDKQGVPLSMIEESLFTNAPVNYQDLTYAEFDSLRNAIEMLLHQGRRVRTIIRQGHREAIEKIVEEMKTELVETFAQSKRDPNEESAFGRYIRDRMFDHMKLSNLIRKMVGGKDTSVMHQMILNPLNEAGDREVSMIREVAQKLNDLTNKKLGSESMTKKIRLNLSSGPKMLSRTTRLAIALNSGNQQNRDRLHSSKNGYTLGDINLILSSLTKSELEWVQGVWDLIDSFWPMLAEVERRTNGLPPQKVEAEPFNVTLGDGTVVAMRGGYYPIKYDRRLSIDAARNEMEAYGKDIIKGAFASATTKQGFAKERKNHVDLPLKLDLFVPGLHLKEVIHDICFRETLQTVNRLVRNKDFADLIEQRFGADYYESIKDTLLAVASDGSGASANAMLGTALSYLKGNVTFAALSASVTTVFLQPLGILQSIQRIGLTNVLNGYVKLAKQGSLANIEKTCLDKSEFMRNRKFTMNAELNEIGRRLDRRNWKIARGVDAIEKVLFAPMQGVQLWMVDLATWYGAYEKARAEGNNDELAVKVANQTVRDAQGSGLILDQAKIQRDNPLFTIFYSYFNSTLNLAADSWRENVLKKKNAIGSLVFIRDLLMLTAVPQLATELIFSLLRGDDWEDREPEDWAKLGVSAATGSMLSMFVGLREVTGLLNGYSYSGPVVLRVFNDIDRCWDALTSEDPDAEKIAQRSISLLSNVIKIPATQINRTWKGIEAYMDGETDTPTSVLFGAPKDN